MVFFFFWGGGTTSLYSATSGASTSFDEDLVHPRNRNKTSSEEPDLPADIIQLKEELRRADFLLKHYKGMDCEPFYNSKRVAAQVALDEVLGPWQSKVAEKREKRRKEIQRLYTLACYGEADRIRRLLFHLSSTLIDPKDLKEITFAINSLSGVPEIRVRLSARPSVTLLYTRWKCCDAE